MKIFFDKNDEFFIEEIKRFSKYFNLLNWDIRFKKIDSDNTKAQCAVADDEGEALGLIVEMQYDKGWIKKADFDSVSYTAFHETIELLLMPLRIMIADPEIYHSYKEVDTEIHRIINTLCNTIWRDFLKFKPKEKKMAKKVKGFKENQKKISQTQGISMERAGAILAEASRNASKKAKKKNPKLKKVRGK